MIFIVYPKVTLPLHNHVDLLVLQWLFQTKKVKLPTANCQLPSAPGTSSAEPISKQTKTISSSWSSSDQTTWRHGGSNFPNGGTTKRQQQFFQRCDGNPEAIGCQLWKIRQFQFCEANDTWWVGLGWCWWSEGWNGFHGGYYPVFGRGGSRLVSNLFKYFFYFHPYMGKISILST